MSMHVDRRKDWMRSRRKKRKQARKARFNRQVLRYVMLGLLVWGGCSALTKLSWQLTDPAVDVVVHGNGVVETAQIRDALGPISDRNIFQLDPRKLEQKLESLKAVKYAFVRRYAFPKPTLVVEVLEEFPWAVFSTDPDQAPEAVISQSGRLIPLKDFPRMAQPPMCIYGAPSLKLTSKEVSQWASWSSYISAQTGQPVQFIDLRKPYDVRVQDGDLYLKLGASDATLTRRLGRLSSILTALQPLKSRLEYVDLGLDNNVPLKLAKKPIDGRQPPNFADRLQAAQPTPSHTM